MENFRASLDINVTLTGSCNVEILSNFVNRLELEHESTAQSARVINETNEN